MTEREASPYLIGAGIGLLNAFAFATADRGLGVTTAFESAAALSEQRLAPDATHVNAYLTKREELPKVGWEMFLVAGVVAGSFLAASASSEPRAPAIPDAWQRRFGASKSKRAAAALIGGAAMMFGARMAKGCTSGHCITGTSQLAASSWLFSPLMAISAAVTTRALYGKEEADGSESGNR